MTPAQIETAVRAAYNATNDSFFATSEILQYIYDACNELATEAECIRRVYTSTTTAGTRSYDLPTDAFKIKRVSVNGLKLKPITMRDDDVLTLGDDATTSTGTPQYYYIWDRTLCLRATPDTSAQTIRIYTYNFPQSITATSTLEVPTEYHNDLQKYVLMQMYAKDQNLPMVKHYQGMWEAAKAKAIRWERKKLRGDQFAEVQDGDMLIDAVIGIV